jgi:hypothetical protein
LPRGSKIRIVLERLRGETSIAELDDPLADIVRDAVPDPRRPRLSILQSLESTGLATIEPGVKRRLRNADLRQRAPDRQRRGLDGSNDFMLRILKARREIKRRTIEERRRLHFLNPTR